MAVILGSGPQSSSAGGSLVVGRTQTTLTGVGGVKVGGIGPATTGGIATPSTYYPDLPLGGSYSSLLEYFVLKGVWTYQFAGIPPDKACAVLGVVFWNYKVTPKVYQFAMYLYLDNSLAPNDWYYVYRYLLGGQSDVPPSTAPKSGSPGPPRPFGNLVLQGENPMLNPVTVGSQEPWIFAPWLQ
jgi:hypothetical protein